MRAVFLCEKESTIQRVYSDDVIRKLEALTGLDKTVYNQHDLLENPLQFADTEYVFSSWGMPPLSEEVITSCFPNLKCVFYAAGTVQKFARPFLNCGVKVFSAWAANAVPVAEYTTAQIVLANKGFFKLSRLASSGKRDEAQKEMSAYIGNYNAKIGIIGAGMIGKLVIKMLKAYKLEILVFDPFLSDNTAGELGVQKASLERLFRECNVVSNHLANNEQTKGMLDYKLFSSMQRYATFINTGRGAQVREVDLIRVLRERADITAILDVTYPEPPSPESELYKLDNCFLTPHIAGSIGREVHRMSEYMLEEFYAYLQNEPCNYEVNIEMLNTMA